MTRIAIDVQTTKAAKTGLGFYVANLTRQLPKVAPEYDFQLIAPSSRGDLNMPRRLYWDQVGFPWRARGADLIHQPAFSAPLLSGKSKVVVTVHDLISLIYRDLPFWPTQYFCRWMPFAQRFADHMIADSVATKQDIIRLLGMPEEKITVVHLASDPEFKPVTDRAKIATVKEKYQIPGPYIIHIGTLNPRKNLEFLVRVFGRIAARYPKLSLVISGNKGWYYERIVAQAEQLGLRDRVILTGYVAEEDAPVLLGGAEIMAFPSLYEGFGLPPLEAMASRVPVVGSNASSLPEVIGDAGLLVAPTDEAGWVKALTDLLDKPDLRTKMVERGLRQASSFSWEQTARETVAVYRKVLGGHHD